MNFSKSQFLHVLRKTIQHLNIVALLLVWLFLSLSCKSIWIKASAQWLNVNEMFWKICSPIMNSIRTLSCWLSKGRSNLMMMMNSWFLRTMRLVFLYWLVLCAFLLSIARISTLSTERACVAAKKTNSLHDLLNTNILAISEQVNIKTLSGV